MATAVLTVWAVVFVCLLRPSMCYDAIDYEIFDLVEEINRNFYEVLGVDSKATTSEIRKGYRRVAILYHPDKNKEDDAEKQFTQIAAIYEVLKDEEKRQKYDLVLETGLPDWKQPVYYYRRVRKLGLVEILGILFAILTVGHFLVLWAGYIEKKYEMEEVIRSRQRKDKRAKGRNKLAMEAREVEFEDQLQEQLDSVPRPRLLDLVPCRLIVLLWWSAKSVAALPGQWAELRAKKEAERLEKQIEMEEEERLEAILKQQELQRKGIKKVNLVELRGEMMSSIIPSAPKNTDTPDTCTDEEILTTKPVKTAHGEWCDDDMALLAKAVAKFPGGIPNRWVKISDMVGRSVKEVTDMSKNIKQGYTRAINASSQGITGTENTAASNPELRNISIITQSDRSACPQNEAEGTEALLRQRKTTQKAQAVDLVLPRGTNSLSNTDRHRTTAVDAPSHFINQPSTANRTSSKEIKLPTDGTLVPNQQSNLKHSHSAVSPMVSADDGSSSLKPAADNIVWSQNQQKILEWALTQYPRGTTDRWGEVAQHIPGKSKEDCLIRYKHLADIVKKKKEQQSM